MRKKLKTLINVRKQLEIFILSVSHKAVASSTPSEHVIISRLPAEANRRHSSLAPEVEKGMKGTSSDEVEKSHDDDDVSKKPSTNQLAGEAGEGKSEKSENAKTWPIPPNKSTESAAKFDIFNSVSAMLKLTKSGKEI